MDQNKNKTIAIFINTSWNIYNFRLELMRSLQCEGYRVVAIAPKDRYSKKIEQAGFEHHAIDINNLGTNPLEDLVLTGKIFRLYRKIQPDLLLHYTIKPNLYGSYAAKLAGIPVISNITGLGTVFLNNKFSYRVARKFYRTALRIPRKVFFQNPHDRNYFVETKLVAMHKTELLPGSGIDHQRYSPVEKDHNGGQPFVFLLIARMLKDKGVVEFVQAAQNLLQRSGGVWRGEQQKRVEFWLLGTMYPGNPTAIREQEVEAWTKQEGIRYLGETDDVVPVIAQSDCVVLPSYREGLSRVLLEASSMARPLITTDVPGCRDVVDDGVNGYLCKPKDVQDLTVQMERMLQLSRDELQEMGKAGRRKIIEEFSEHLVIDKYLAVIKQILG
jgi:glycosyltransferase involved in cell wall biosynthesis